MSPQITDPYAQIATLRRGILELRDALDEFVEVLDTMVPQVACASSSTNPIASRARFAEYPRRVGEAVAEALGVPWSALAGRDRHEPLATLRMVAICAVSHHTKCSTREIAAAFGGRTHAAILYSQRTIRNRIHCDLESGAIAAGASDVARWLARASLAAAAACHRH